MALRRSALVSNPAPDHVAPRDSPDFLLSLCNFSIDFWIEVPRTVDDRRGFWYHLAVRGMHKAVV